MIKQKLKDWLLKRGVLLQRPPGQFSIQHLKLAAAKARGLKIESAIDAGASDGRWARQFKQTFPEAQVLCVEPRETCLDGLKQTARDLPGVQFAATLLGAHEGNVALRIDDVQSSILADARGAGDRNVKEYPMTTLDQIVAARGFPGPDLIKLDLQGAELEALKGAEQSLQRAQMILCEVSFIEMRVGNPLFEDVMDFCRQRGFRLYDIAGLLFRPLDGALAEGDFMFLKRDHPLLADRRWSESFGQW